MSILNIHTEIVIQFVQPTLRFVIMKKLFPVDSTLSSCAPCLNLLTTHFTSPFWFLQHTVVKWSFIDVQIGLSIDGSVFHFLSYPSFNHLQRSITRFCKLLVPLSAAFPRPNGALSILTAIGYCFLCYPRFLLKAMLYHLHSVLGSLY